MHYDLGQYPIAKYMQEACAYSPITPQNCWKAESPRFYFTVRLIPSVDVFCPEFHEQDGSMQNWHLLKVLGKCRSKVCYIGSVHIEVCSHLRTSCPAEDMHHVK